MTNRPQWVRIRETDREEGSDNKWHERIDAEELEFNMPGFGGRIKGREIIVIVSCLIAFASMGYIIHNDAAADHTAHEAIQSNQRELIEQMEVQNWLLSMPQNRRPALKRPTNAHKYLLKEEN